MSLVSQSEVGSGATGFEAIDIAPKIGSEIRADRAALIRGEFSDQIADLLEQRGGLLIREFNLTTEEQLAFTATLGPVVEQESIFKISMDPDVNPVADYVKGAFFWHIDGTTLDAPMHLGFLSCQKKSPVGGQTALCNTYAAYEALSDEDKSAIADLRVVHTFEASQRYVTPEPSYELLQQWRQFPSRTLPLVWTHRSGRKSLVLGSTASHIEGMDYQDSQNLLTRLRDWATGPQFSYVHEWTVGDLLMWDNTGTMHKACPYPMDSGRLMHRTQIHGDEPVV